MDERTGPERRRRPSAEELEEMMAESEEEIVAILERYRLDEVAAAEIVADAALAVALEPVARESLRDVFLDTVERAAHEAWAVREPGEDEHVVN